MTEGLWAGKFGDSYLSRNSPEDLLPSRLALFSRVLERTGTINRVLELGCSAGANLLALRALLPKVELAGVEVHAESAKRARAATGAKVYQGSLLDWKQDGKPFDLAFVAGVLIHIPPSLLPEAYRVLVRSSRRYVLLAEYYNPEPVDVSYRGDTLWKRDFAGEMLDAYPELRLVDYGFAYHRDTVFDGNDLTWFLIEKMEK